MVAAGLSVCGAAMYERLGAGELRATRWLLITWAGKVGREMSDQRRETELLHATFDKTGTEPPLGEPLTPPLVLTTSFHFPSLAVSREVARGDRPGYVYTRGGNPTVKAVEKAVSRLEKAEASLVVASGMAATTTTLMTLLAPGDHVVVGVSQYGGTYGFLHGVANRMGIRFTAVDGTDMEAVKAAIRPETRLIFMETISNPMMTVPPLDAIGQLSRELNLPLVVDNTFASGVLFCPLEHGATVVVNSATKYMNGHGDTVIGTISGSADIIGAIRDTLNQLGGIANPFAAYMMWRGMATLPARMRLHSASALQVAEALARMPGIERVLYPGLTTHPQHAWVARHFTGGMAGGMMSVVLDESTDVDRFVDSLRLFHTAVSLGDTTSLIEQPVALTHRRLTDDEKASMGLTPRVLRLSIGLESPDDLVEDLRQALAKAR
jgi:cystathionine beta-lyase/cystathionine gamma-synthase